MNITVIPLRKFVFDENSYFGRGPDFVRYLEKLSQYFDKLTVCAPVVRGNIKTNTAYNTKFVSRNILFCELPAVTIRTNGIFNTVIGYMRSAKILLREIKNWDALYIFMPGYLGVITFLVTKLRKKPFCLYIAGDWGDFSKAAFFNKETKLLEKIARLTWAYFVQRLQKVMYNSSLFTLVAGEKLFKKYGSNRGNSYLRIPIMNMTTQDLWFRSDTCFEGSIKCLYVGTLSRNKGVIYLLRAIALLRKKMIDISLYIVGLGPLRQELEIVVKNLSILDNVKFLGYIPWNKNLLDIYRKCDFFVFPSLSEGFPRVLYEAMGQSLPIVTTNVGSIPNVLRDEKDALLVPSKCPLAIAKSIKKLIKDSNLRQRLIKNGYKTAEEICSQNPSKQFISLFKNYFQAS